MEIIIDEKQEKKKTKKQYYVDASALKNSACFRHFWLNTIDGLKHRSNQLSNHKLSFGSAIHKFLEATYLGQDFKVATKLALDYYEPYNKTLPLTSFEFRTSTNLIYICDAYRRRFRDEGNIDIDFKPLVSSSGKPLVEYKFCIPIWSNDTVELFLAGTIDLVCSFAGYNLVLVDHKSTAAKLSEDFFNNYDWDIQTMLYSKVWKEAMGLDYYPSVVINGIFCKKPTKKALDTGTFDGVEFDRSNIITYDTEVMEEFSIWLELRLKTIIHYLENQNNLNPFNNYDMSACKSIYGSCPYFKICKTPLAFREGIMLSEYEKIPYNPLKFRD